MALSSRANRWVGVTSGAVSTGTLHGGLYGAFSAAVFFGIGTGFSKLAYNGGGDVFGTGLSSGEFSAKVLAHGVAGGVMSRLQGGKFGDGFLSAGVAELSSPMIDNIGPGRMDPSYAPARVAVAAVVGGTTSAITGGKFANGAITAAFGRAFNSELHRPVPISDAEKQMLDNKDLAGYWRSRFERGDPWGREGASIWDRGNPGLSDSDLAKGALVMDRLVSFMAARDGYDLSNVGSMRSSVIAGLAQGYRGEIVNIGLSIAEAHTQFLIRSGGVAPTLLDGAKYHHVVFANYGLPASAYGGTPFGGGSSWWIRQQAVLTNDAVGYCVGCEP